MSKVTACAMSSIIVNKNISTTASYYTVQDV